jgi:hypothetical protein
MVSVDGFPGVVIFISAKVQMVYLMGECDTTSF